MAAGRFAMGRETMLMIYTKFTKKALAMCFEAHRDQVDKSGMPYVFHPFHLAEQMDDEDSTCVALLHDVMEDADFTVDDICDLGMPENVIEALLLLTHDEAEPYLDYVDRVARNPLAAKVKRADLRHNSDLTRLDEITDRDRDRVKKYEKALAILEDGMAV